MAAGNERSFRLLFPSSIASKVDGLCQEFTERMAEAARAILPTLCGLLYASVLCNFQMSCVILPKHNKF